MEIGWDCPSKPVCRQMFQIENEVEMTLALTCPIDLDVATLRAEVQTMYSRVASAPTASSIFIAAPNTPRRDSATTRRNSPRCHSTVTSSFAGVGNPHAIDRIPAGQVVLDVGCGAGTDLLLAAMRVGPHGRAIGVDMTAAMRDARAAGAAACGLSNVEVRDGDATSLGVDSGSVDVVISNGVLNLVPDKHRAIAEIARVLKPGGRVQIADIVIGEVLPDDALRDIDLWTG